MEKSYQHLEKIQKRHPLNVGLCSLLFILVKILKIRFMIFNGLLEDKKSSVEQETTSQFAEKFEENGLKFKQFMHINNMFKEFVLILVVLCCLLFLRMVLVESSKKERKISTNSNKSNIFQTHDKPLSHQKTKILATEIHL